MGPILDKRVTTLVNELIADYWDNWDEKTQDFPDTIDANEVKLRILNISVVGIVTNYIMGHKSEFREEEVNKMIQYIDGIRGLFDDP